MKNIFISTLVLLTLGVGYFYTKNTEQDKKEFQVGIVYLLDHPAIEQGLDGFKKGIVKIEAKYNAKLNTTYSNAYGEIKNVNSILSSFKNTNKDIIIALTTPCAQVAKKTIQNKPIVFVGVTDPVQAGLIDSLDSGKNNVVGTTSVVPYDKILTLYKELYPNLKKIGIVYSQQEANSLVILERIKNIIKSKNLNLEIIPRSIINTNDIYKVTTALSSDVDSFMIINDSAIVSSMKIVLKVAKENNMPVFASDIDTVKGGALFTYGLNYKDEGLAASKLLEDILFKDRKPSDINIYINNKSYLYIHDELLKNQKLKESIKSNATIIKSK